MTRHTPEPEQCIDCGAQYDGGVHYGCPADALEDAAISTVSKLDDMRERLAELREQWDKADPHGLIADDINDAAMAIDVAIDRVRDAYPLVRWDRVFDLDGEQR